MKLTTARITGLLAGCALFLSACSLQFGGIPSPTSTSKNTPIPPTSTPSPSPEPPTPTPTQLVIAEAATVESIQLNVMESFPVKANLEILGNLPDDCTEVRRIAATTVEDTFDVRVLTQRPAQAECAQDVVPFEETLPLDVLGLPAGQYTVNVYAHSAALTLDEDNVPPETSTCRAPGEGLQLFSHQEDNLNAGYCFLHPVDFDLLPDRVEDYQIVAGPELDPGPDMTRAAVTVTTVDREGRTLEQYVEEQISLASRGTPVDQSTISLGPEAQGTRVEGFPMRVPVRVVYSEYRDQFYILVFAPKHEEPTPARSDMERLYESVIASWMFLE